MVAGMQSNRMNDQRATLPDFPGLHNSQAIRDLLARQKQQEQQRQQQLQQQQQQQQQQQLNTQQAMPDDSFFEMLMRCQVSDSLGGRVVRTCGKVLGGQNFA